MARNPAESGRFGDSGTLPAALSVREHFRARGTANEPQRLLAVLNVLASVPTSEMTTKCVERAEQAIAAIKDETRRAALMAEFESVKSKLGEKK